MKRVVIRTHGGFGNQLFQVFYALVRHQGTIILKHDSRYPHGFLLANCFESHFIESTTVFESLICGSRMVKLLEKGSIATPELKLGSTTFLDGYFQKTDLYTPLDAARLSHGLSRLRDILELNGQPRKNMLCHIRLADFFKTDVERTQAARTRLMSLSNQSDFISSDDKLILGDELCQKLICKKSLMHIETDGYSAEEIFRLMSDYRIIDSNNSTLAFWAAVLNDSELIVDDINLKRLFSLLTTPRQLMC